MCMAHICIIGDSFGHPILGGDFPQDRYTPGDHTEHQLRDVYGYKVRNYSRGAISNLEAVRRFRDNPPRLCDVIIWFGTESFRDWHDADRHRFSIDAKTEEIMAVAYSEFEQIRSHYDADCILIGGQAPLHPVRKGIVNRVIWELEDWRAELLGYPDLEGSHLLCHPYIFGSTGCTDSVQVQLRKIETVNKWLDLMDGHAHFPDNCHPGGAAHRSLSMRINKIIQGRKPG